MEASSGETWHYAGKTYRGRLRHRLTEHRKRWTSSSVRRAKNAQATIKVGVWMTQEDPREEEILRRLDERIAPCAICRARKERAAHADDADGS